MPLIQVTELVRTYVEPSGVVTEALRGVDLAVNAGDFVALAGPSGSGKSTLLNLIGALDKPCRGTIYYEGRDVTGVATSDLSDFRLRTIGFVFQSYNLVNTLTALENTEYTMLLQGVEAKVRRQRAEDILRRVGLGSMFHRRPNQMSGGQQQRVAVARAIVTRPKVVLADEPTANLDSATAASLIDLMRQLNKEDGISFIIATHDRMVMEKVDKVMHMKDGRFVA